MAFQSPVTAIPASSRVPEPSGHHAHADLRPSAWSIGKMPHIRHSSRWAPRDELAPGRLGEQRRTGCKQVAAFAGLSGDGSYESTGALYFVQHVFVFRASMIDQVATCWQCMAQINAVDKHSSAKTAAMLQ